ncbi:hypothetical protein FHT32_003312 [Variovorax sp. SG517]|uniref:hypothetical protein n=1 Tax=Variovorax sp. SG517 TaxID=2587117 RepID=UPI00159E156C|nr:hypothetical protein [Variovorax sp. SG517]NVM89655.1 hypothetical protein [Variovorax sp. SG517]
MKKCTVEQAWSLSLRNFQLLSLLEVMCSYEPSDLDYLLDARDATVAFAASMKSLKPTRLMDPSGQIREWLDACQRKASPAGAISRRLQEAESARDSAQDSWLSAMPQMADACKAMLSAIETHDALARSRELESNGAYITTRL